MAESAFEFAAVVPGLGRYAVAVAVAGVVWAQPAELAVGSVDVQVVNTTDLADDRVMVRGDRRPPGRRVLIVIAARNSAIECGSASAGRSCSR